MKDKVKKFIYDCGNECDVVEPYGFVPEARCRIHDDPETVNACNELYGIYGLEDGEIFVANNVALVEYEREQYTLNRGFWGSQ